MAKSSKPLERIGIPAGTCACCGCDRRIDYFKRDTLGGFWTIASGTWPLVSGQLTTQSSNAKILQTMSPPRAGQTVYVRVDVRIDTAGDEAKVIADNAANIYAKIIAEVTETTFQLWDNTKKIGETTLDGNALGTTWTVCISIGLDGVAIANFSSGWPPDTEQGNWGLLYGAVSQSGDITGLGTGTVTGTVYFDRFEISRHNDEDRSCPECLGPEEPCDPECCQPDTAPPYLIAEISELDGDWSDRNGRYILDLEPSCARCKGLSLDADTGCWMYCDDSGDEVIGVSFFSSIVTSFPPGHPPGESGEYWWLDLSNLLGVTNCNTWSSYDPSSPWYAGHPMFRAESKTDGTPDCTDLDVTLPLYAVGRGGNATTGTARVRSPTVYP